MNMKYSDKAENKCIVETSLSANFKCIFPSDWVSGSTWRCRCIRQRGSMCGWEWEWGRSWGHEVPRSPSGLSQLGKPQEPHWLLVRSPRSSADVGYLAMGFFFVEKDFPPSLVLAMLNTSYLKLWFFSKKSAQKMLVMYKEKCVHPPVTLRN